MLQLPSTVMRRSLQAALTASLAWANQPSYRIRGIGTSDFGIGADPAVGVYQDGVYIGRSGGSKVAFNDLARVEILNGPQDSCTYVVNNKAEGRPSDVYQFTKAMES